MSPHLTLSILPDTFAICRLEPGASVPTWTRGDVVSLTRTHDELSIVCAQANVPAEIKCERNWRALKVKGQLDFALTGILASIATPLADAGISIFALSTFDTDYVLIKQDALQQAINVLQAAGHQIDNLKSEI